MLYKIKQLNEWVPADRNDLSREEFGKIFEDLANDFYLTDPDYMFDEYTLDELYERTVNGESWNVSGSTSSPSGSGSGNEWTYTVDGKTTSDVNEVLDIVKNKYGADAIQSYEELIIAQREEKQEELALLKEELEQYEDIIFDNEVYFEMTFENDADSLEDIIDNMLADDMDVFDIQELLQEQKLLFDTTSFERQGH